MKNINKLLTGILTITLILGLSACDKALEVITLAEERAVTLELLSTDPWGASAITRSDVDAASEFPDFSLAFGDGRYTAENGKHVWADAGTWEFVKDRSDQIIRDDDVIIDLDIDGDKLTLSFELEENVFSIGGRSQTALSRFIFNLFRRP